MKKITMLYLETCPYCNKARGYIEELRNDNPAYAKLEIDMIEEEENPDVIANYDYYYVPCFYFGDEKFFEPYSMIPDDELYNGVKSVLDEALS